MSEKRVITKSSMEQPAQNVVFEDGIRLVEGVETPRLWISRVDDEDVDGSKYPPGFEIVLSRRGYSPLIVQFEQKLGAFPLHQAVFQGRLFDLDSFLNPRHDDPIEDACFSAICQVLNAEATVRFHSPRRGEHRVQLTLGDAVGTSTLDEYVSIRSFLRWSP